MNDKDLWKLYCKTIHSVQATNSSVWAKTALTMPQIKIMFILAHRGEINVSSIAQSLNVRVPNVTFIVDHLEEQKLVARRRSKSDRRQVMIALTNKGRQLIDKFSRAKLESFQKAIAKMSNQDKEALCQGLQALEKACSQEEAGGIDE